MAEKAKKVLSSHKPEVHTIFNKELGDYILTDMIWFDTSKGVMIEMLHPLEMETKFIYKINFNGEKK